MRQDQLPQVQPQARQPQELGGLPDGAWPGRPARPRYRRSAGEDAGRGRLLPGRGQGEHSSRVFGRALSLLGSPMPIARSLLEH